MAQKNIIYDINGKTKETSVNYYDDSSNSIVVKNASFATSSIDLQNGIAYINNTNISSSGNVSGNSTITWNSSNNQWVIQPNSTTNVVAQNPAIPASSDVTGTFANGLLAKNLSNVRIGSALPVAYGGTGLKASDIPVGESLLVGNGTSSFTFITASSLTGNLVLHSSDTGWNVLTQSATTISAEVSIFTSSAVWYKPSGTTCIRVLAQGAGGGGGSGANRNSAVPIIGGAGGSAGAYVDSGLFVVTEQSASVIVGTGGAGAVYPNTNSSGIAGGNGENSSFGDYIYANGGNGGAAGALNSTTTVNGGASVTGTDYTFLSLTSKINAASSAGGNAPSTTGGSVAFVTTQNGAGGGAGGGASNVYGDVYNGGNSITGVSNGGTTSSVDSSYILSSSIALSDVVVDSSSQTNNFFISSGGGGGGSSASLDWIGEYRDTVFLSHHDVSEPYKDRSVNNYTVSTSALVSIGTATSFGIPNPPGTFSDGVLKSINGSATGVSAYTIGSFAPAGNFSMESWFYLTSYGASTATGAYKSILLTAGRTGGANTGMLLNIMANGNFNLATPTTTRDIGVACQLNTWQHLLMQRSGSVMQVYRNGNLIYQVTFSPNVNGEFSYGPSRDYPSYNFIGYAKELRFLNRAQSSSEILQNYNNIINGTAGPYLNPTATLSPSPGGLGGNGAWGSGGGGGGASTNAPTPSAEYDYETISLRHFDLSETTTDRSLYGNLFYSGTQNIISTGSAGVSTINSQFSDGVLSSSYLAQRATGWDSTWVASNKSITDNFTLESWVYLTNAGQSGDNNFLSSILAAGYTGAGPGLLVGINSANQLQIWTNGAFNPGNNPRTLTLNSWNHIAITKSGTTHVLYLNGVPTTYVNTSTVANNKFGYGLLDTIFTHYNPNGYFKEFMLTDRVKTQLEIQNYYNAIIGNVLGSYPNPVGIQQGGNGGDGYVAVISYKL